MRKDEMELGGIEHCVILFEFHSVISNWPLSSLDMFVIPKPPFLPQSPSHEHKTE